MKQLAISSPVFSDRDKIPSKYTCDGEDINPPLTFEHVPDETRSLALIVEDQDSPGKMWTHWVVFNIPPTTAQIIEDSVPDGSNEGMTDFGKTGYGGPCPHSGTHRYYFRLYALDTSLSLTEDVTLDELKAAMDNHILDEASIMALYSRE